MVYRRPKDKYGNEDTRYPENWLRLRGYVFKRDGYRCQICGRKSDLICHHIQPLGMGGTNNSRNLVTLCKSCHKRIHGKK